MTINKKIPSKIRWKPVEFVIDLLNLFKDICE